MLAWMAKPDRFISLHNSLPAYQLRMPAAARFIFPMLATDPSVFFELSLPPLPPPPPLPSSPLYPLSLTPLPTQILCLHSPFSLFTTVKHGLIGRDGAGWLVRSVGPSPAAATLQTASDKKELPAAERPSQLHISQRERDFACL